MANKINLITGETYTLGELFSGTRRIIIPDLQRDYCWGNKPDGQNSKSLAEGFVETLLEQFDSHPYGRLSLGLLYGYESPTDNVQLCDGQQRITTLFLLLGMLNRWIDDDRYRHYLMSDFEFYEDDHEPYLLYSIRESSLYFMSDLVYRFFIHETGEQLQSVSSIYDFSTGESCSWFYGEYATDPSITSMLRCLESIEKMKTQILPDGIPNRIEALMEFLVDRLTFIYYDMATRANGEETFVVINTTGEPLSMTENLKPLVINADINRLPGEQLHNINGKALSTAKAWEEMENYFWKTRRCRDFDTADNGFKEFLRWVTLLETYDSANQELFQQISQKEHDYSFPYKEIPITKIIKVFNAFVRLRNGYPGFFDLASTPGQGDKLEQKELFVLLPLLAYLSKHTTEDSRQIKRFWNWLVNLTRISNVGKSVNELLSDVIHIGFNITDPIEILCINGISATILTEEERFKLEVISACPDEDSRNNLEEDIWNAQKMEVDIERQLLFDGEIKTMLLWATPNCTLDTTKFDRAKFKFYLSALKSLLTIGSQTVNNLTRRALLAWRYRGFPSGKSYGWGSTWKGIIAFDPVDFRRFIDSAMSLGLEHIIRLDSTCNPIARYPGLLAYSDKKNFESWAISGHNICKRYYAEPIPVALAAIMARMGADIERNSIQNCGDWHLSMTKTGALVFKPKTPGQKRVDEIIVTSVEGGKMLRYNVKAPGWEIDITLPLASADILLCRLNPSATHIRTSRGNERRDQKRCTRRGRRN